MKQVYPFILGLFFVRASFAQELRLHDAVRIALKNSFSIQIAKNNVDIAAISNNYGIAGGLPFVLATGSDNGQLTSIKQQYANPANNKSSTNVSSNVLSAGLTGSVLLYNGHRVVTAKERLGVVEEQSKQQLSSRALVLAYNVMLKYYDIVRQQSYAKTLELSIEASKEKLNIVKAQQGVGLANNTDLFQAEVDLNTQTLNLKAQVLVVDQDKTDLLTLLTLNPDSTITIEDTIVVEKNIQLGSVLDLVQQNPDILAASQQVIINQHIEKEVAAFRYPSLSFSTGYNYAFTKNAVGFSLLNLSYGPFAGINLSVPIFNGTIYKRQQQIAGINTKNADIMKDTLALSYASIAVKNFQAYQNNLQQLETSVENYELSRKLLDLVVQRFQLRQATIVDVKNAQQSFENAGYLLVNVSYAAKAAEIQLKRLSNQLSF
ncbi:MAG TPA: TolC family protein [Puia sp.]|jgi:outer membrane protein|nr:TolC family protein [Puia sp.]